MLKLKMNLHSDSILLLVIEVNKSKLNRKLLRRYKLIEKRERTDCVEFK